MKSARPACHSTEAGFTLIEMLAVLVILAVAAAGLVNALPTSAGGPNVELAAQRIAAGLRSARLRAVRERRSVAVTITPSERLIDWSGHLERINLPSAARVHIVAADSERNGRHATGVRFFPNGAATGGLIVLEHAGKRHEISINWLTGRVTSTVRTSSSRRSPS